MLFEEGEHSMGYGYLFQVDDSLVEVHRAKLGFILNLFVI